MVDRCVGIEVERPAFRPDTFGVVDIQRPAASCNTILERCVFQNVILRQDMVTDQPACFSLGIADRDDFEFEVYTAVRKWRLHRKRELGKFVLSFFHVDDFVLTYATSVFPTPHRH